jgi:hypothetical protein
VLKIAALGPHGYFRQRFNCMDFAIVVVAIPGFFFQVGPAASLFRVFRIFRLFKLVRSAQGLKNLFLTLFYSLPTLWNIGSLLLLMFFVFAVAGVSVLGSVPRGEFITDRANFENFGIAVLTLFRMATGESWNGLMHEATDHIPFAWVYFVLFVFIVFFVLINLFIAVILENFGDLVTEGEADITEEHFDEFSRAWAAYDPAATHYIEIEDVPRLLRSIAPPLGAGAAAADADVNVMLMQLRIPDRAGKVHFFEMLSALAHREVRCAVFVFVF